MNTPLFRTAVGLTALLFHAAACIAAPSRYPLQGDCAGLPNIKLATPPGWCVGLVAQGLSYPRGIEVLPNGDLVVAEMGGWTAHRGRLSILRKSRQYARESLFESLDRPHRVLAGPDGRIYVGTTGGVFRFDPKNPAGTRTDVIGGTSGVAALPGTGMHPVTTFVFDREGHLFVSVGSQTNNCEGDKGTTPDATKPCPETVGTNARGVIRKYSLRWPAGTVAQVETYASGLRNGLALAVHRASNTLLQAENSRDAIHQRDARLSDQALPHDELNVIERGRHYGWPYCYDMNRASPEYRNTDCKAHAAPRMLLPPHAAPLGMAIDNHARLRAPFSGHLLLAYHGYRQGGHRVVAYALDSRGLPRGNAIDLISGWNAAPPPNARPAGTPVDVRIAVDGSIYVTEDRNGTVLRLARP